MALLLRSSFNFGGIMVKVGGARPFHGGEDHCFVMGALRHANMRRPRCMSSAERRPHRPGPLSRIGNGNMAMRSLFLSFTLALAASASTRAAEQPAADPVLAEASDLAGTVMFVNSGAPGMVLVIVRGDNSLVLGYGETEKGNKRTPDGNSIFRLNSITKVFTTEVLVSLVAEGKLSLTDPLQRYARTTKVPTFGTRPGSPCSISLPTQPPRRVRWETLRKACFPAPGWRARASTRRCWRKAAAAPVS
jgi:hypothetical protein